MKWDSVDFDAGTLTIKHTVVKVLETVEKDKTKNATSHRSFPLVPEVRLLLIELKKREAASQKLFGREYILNDYILKWDDGRPFSPDYESQKFRDLWMNITCRGFDSMSFASFLSIWGFHSKTFKND